MKIGEAFPGEFLGANDGGWPRKLTIERFEEHMKVFDEIKPVLFFRELDRGLVLKKTIANQLMAFIGDETDNWIGKEIVVFVDDRVTFGGKPTPALRVRAPKPIPQRVAKPAAPQPSEPDPARDDMNDDIPF